MDLKRRYNSQKANAKRRGIEWQFTFETWLKFWGDDLYKRGQGHDRLCMQRFGDAGPYHPDNCRKDYPLKNNKTQGVIRRSKNFHVGHREYNWAAVHDAYLKTWE
jgi:hypothetical protein